MERRKATRGYCGEGIDISSKDCCSAINANAGLDGHITIEKP